MPAPDLQHQLERDGYAVVRNVVDRALLQRVRAALEPSFRDAPHGRVTNAWVSVPAVRELAAHGGVLDLARPVVGGDPVAFQTLDFRTGTQQRPHADTIHFDTVPSGRMCGVWVAVEDVGPDQGPLVVHPGSHLLPVLTPASLGLDPDAFDVDAYEDAVTALMAERDLPATALELDAGDVAIWVANLVHGGAPIRSAGSTRWSQVTHYAAAGSVLVTPMRSHVERGEFAVREPVVDAVTGRWSRAGSAPGSPAVIHRPGRRSLVGPPAEGAAPVARALSRLVGASRAGRRRAYDAVAARRRPTPI
ncbi:MAG: phytanoyl-CoA dioxygenase family protein [Acidimicrobiales bacterium]